MVISTQRWKIEQYNRIHKFPAHYCDYIRMYFTDNQDVSFLRSYSKPPTVLLTAKHSTRGGNAAAECNGIVSWIEFITKSNFRICVKEQFVQRFDPLAVSYAVLSDVCEDNWTYFNGYCYRKVSSCDSWSNSQATCDTLGANLPSIHSQEENVYIQSLHGGEHSWLGLSDINTEGTFVWSDGTPFDFHYWAKHEPNNFHNEEDCVRTLGFLKSHKYEWNDVNCSDCHRFTCKKDYNECKDFSYDCPVNATCVNSDGSYSCRCPVGYRLDENNCTDVDECSASESVCDVNANCHNTPGSYVCSCKTGFTGNGKTCTEFDECSASVRVCDVNATCQNTLGSYTCSCKAGFTGDGKSCTDVDECSTVVRVCDANATCQNTQGSYLCSCKAGFTGDGKTCTDVDECNASVNVCDVNAECKNTPGSYRCTCKAEFTGDGRTCRVVKNCGDLYKYGKRRSGVYTINPDGLGAFAVFCDQQTAGGGWTVFQKRMDGSVDFYRVWADYKRGFGNLTGEFWLGLDKIDRLTNIGENKLRVDLVDFAGNTAYAEYGLFTVSSENTGYWLEVGDYSGTAGDSLRYHSGYSFSTKDRDNDQSNHNCAEGCKGAWWYNACCQSNLNGLYYHGHNEDGDGIIWYRWKRYTSLKKAEMKMKLVTV